uniref:3'-5' exonuclease domain-containing protein n=1 Tax=Chromera velia CCMP2878 TaxID=1169474 RepID=A0A0G4F728_9ALVE|eukprot:Cvel_15453.t1-p1 / transcript=Cvel_15453.t1 / gene=Cvel_15453 / organism=Chromera_velia_CCMP2878 / gene_product=hypothetical protein / transcript_product=hypothetical protein / location=Cvel_scaffold1144:31935-36569(+) / protein_length=1075 / sequence_SO=supercontig / SO=protein_coding / is_pseudo=false
MSTDQNLSELRDVWVSRDLAVIRKAFDDVYHSMQQEKADKSSSSKSRDVRVQVALRLALCPPSIKEAVIDHLFKFNEFKAETLLAKIARQCLLEKKETGGDEETGQFVSEKDEGHLQIVVSNMLSSISSWGDEMPRMVQEHLVRALDAMSEFFAPLVARRVFLTAALDVSARLEVGSLGRFARVFEISATFQRPWLVSKFVEALKQKRYESALELLIEFRLLQIEGDGQGRRRDETGERDFVTSEEALRTLRLVGWQKAAAAVESSKYTSLLRLVVLLCIEERALGMAEKVAKRAGLDVDAEFPQIAQSQETKAAKWIFMSNEKDLKAGLDLVWGDWRMMAAFGCVCADRRRFAEAVQILESLPQENALPPSLGRADLNAIARFRKRETEIRTGFAHESRDRAGGGRRGFGSMERRREKEMRYSKNTGTAEFLTLRESMHWKWEDSMPEGVEWVASLSALEKTVEYLETLPRGSLVGVDAEWRPSLLPGRTPHVALLQLAALTREQVDLVGENLVTHSLPLSAEALAQLPRPRVFLVDLFSLSDRFLSVPETHTVDELLARLLTSRWPTKVGVAFFSGDWANIQKRNRAVLTQKAPAVQLDAVKLAQKAAQKVEGGMTHAHSASSRQEAVREGGQDGCEVNSAEIAEDPSTQQNVQNSQNQTSSVTGLSSIASLFLGLCLDKSSAVGNWELRPLRPQQVEYAVLDAVTTVVGAAAALGVLCAGLRRTTRNEEGGEGEVLESSLSIGSPPPSTSPEVVGTVWGDEEEFPNRKGGMGEGPEGGCWVGGRGVGLGSRGEGEGEGEAGGPEASKRKSKNKKKKKKKKEEEPKKSEEGADPGSKKEDTERAERAQNWKKVEGEKKKEETDRKSAGEENTSEEETESLQKSQSEGSSKRTQDVTITDKDVQRWVEYRRKGGVGSVPQWRFVVPEQLSKVARKLRGLNVDTKLVSSQRRVLEETADKEGRVVITNERVERRGAFNSPCQVVGGRSVEETVRQILKAFSINPEEEGLCGRCPQCNAQDWQLAEKASLKGVVKEGTLEKHDEFWRCGGCGKVFWEGKMMEMAINHFKTEFISQT